MLGKSKALILFTTMVIIGSPPLFSQVRLNDSSKINNPDTAFISSSKKVQVYKLNENKVFVYSKPKPFGFITDLPKDAGGIAVTSVKRKSIIPLLIIGGSTLLLLPADQPITDGIRDFSRNIDFQAEEEYTDIINLKAGSTNISILKAPKNLNTGLYQIGQGFPSLIIGAGLFTYGKINHNYRALSTANQLAESFILLGVSTQLLKRVSGRQSPSSATAAGGEWHLFPSFNNFQRNTPNYDAFPSGHLATLISTVTILAENYPEKRYIKPVGYSVMGLVGLAMINNNVHWISDYPLALGLGYVCAMQVVKTKRKQASPCFARKNKAPLSCTLDYFDGRMVPGIRYDF